jgi:hypothetical protein
MKFKNKFNVNELLGRPAKLRDWVKIRRFPSWLLFIIIGIISTIWFIIRVVPKPSRASYPCMRVAAPFMSGFVLYLLAVGGFTIASRKTKLKILNVRYLATILLVTSVVVAMAISPSQNTNGSQNKSLKTGPDDGPNQPIGKGIGVNPGRVIWVWDPKATKAECINTFEFYKPENTNQSVVNRMVVDAVKRLGGKTNLYESWDALFHSFNFRKNKVDKGYTTGEKIFIKINQGTANANIRQDGRINGYYFSKSLTETEGAKNGILGTCETNPGIVLEILRELVNVVGVEQKDISIGDPISHIFGHNYEAWSTEFPDVVYADRSSINFGRTLIAPTSKELIFYSDKTQNDKLYDIIENADYMINIANLKPHGRAGISLTAKNHFGSQGRNSAFHLHYSLISPVSLGNPSNDGYHKYRVLVDMMGSKYLGQNTILFIIDGLYGGGSNETKVPVKYLMSPFNNDWTNSIFISQDQVALESVCFDFLRTEWNGINKHNPANNTYESIPNVNGVDDYLHQAADPANWPNGLTYDPDNSGKPLGSLGIHEHWNNSENKQYSRNLGHSNGIELISIPDTLVKREVSESIAKEVVSKEAQVISGSTVAVVSAQEGRQNIADGTGKTATKDFTAISVVNRSFDEGVTAKNFHSVTVDDENTIWFSTESGIVSFDGKKWTVHNKNRKVLSTNLKDLAFDFSSYGRELWIATPQGATVASLPVDARTGATTYHTENTTILSDNVLSVAVGKGSLRWFGTDKGVSAFRNKKWLTYSYQRKYPEGLFKDYPITALATSPDGDSLYVATEGAGVARVFRDKVDAISGASEYAQWGPIELPSDKVYSICITPDGTQWFGTDMGVARHIGYNTLEKWTVFNKENGLVDNFVQAIASDAKGNLWFGTKSGVSVYNGQVWKSYTTSDGLNSNNILCITTDKNGTVWLGTNNGVISYSKGSFSCYR